MIRRSLASLCLVLLVLCLPALALESDDSQLIEKIEAIAADSLKEPGAVGLSIAVAKGDRMILAKGYGYADLEHQVPMTERSMLRLASVTKQYTAALIMQMVEAGELALDDPLAKYVDYPVGEHEVTIRHLLNHTSGIHSYTSIEEFWTTYVSRDLTDEQMLDLVRDREFDFAPGEKFLYNNTAYYLLGMVIEKIAGKSYGDAVLERLLAPLGLDQTRYDVNAEVIPHRARGYSLGETGTVNSMLIGMRNPGAAGGLMATTSDLIRWQRALMGGRVVSSESLAKMIAPTVLNDGSVEDYGFGLIKSKQHDRDCILHGGGINGFSSMLAYFPDEDLHVAVISNSDVFPAGRVAVRIAGAALGIEERAAADQPVPQAMIDRITGKYVLEQIGLEIRFWGEGDALMTQATGQPPIPLKHLGNGVFGANFDPSLRMTFPVNDGDADEPVPSFTLNQGGMVFEARRTE